MFDLARVSDDKFINWGTIECLKNGCRVSKHMDEDHPEDLANFAFTYGETFTPENMKESMTGSSGKRSHPTT